MIKALFVGLFVIFLFAFFCWIVFSPMASAFHDLSWNGVNQFVVVLMFFLPIFLLVLFGLLLFLRREE